MQHITILGISLRMRVLLALLFVAAVAQAIDVDWSTVKTMDVIPEDIAGLLDERLGHEDPLASRIVGGVEATPGQFPYQIGLLASTPAGTGFCGGSILNEEWILTAAHCVDVATSVEVIVGAHNVVDPEEGQLRIQASEIIVHANWSPSIIKDDLALLKLSEPLVFSDRIQPTRLPTRSQASNNFVQEIGTVSGWGRPSDSATAISPVLRWTSNDIVTQLTCLVYYFFINIDRDQICLSGTGGRSSCNGDSGGPLVVTDTDGQTTQVGVASLRTTLVGCSAGWPGVYARVTSYLDWIETNTGGSVVIRD